jgi:hypothetical protein
VGGGLGVGCGGRSGGGVRGGVRGGGSGDVDSLLLILGILKKWKVVHLKPGLAPFGLGHLGK